jgi:hypothetical protein
VLTPYAACPYRMASLVLMLAVAGSIDVLAQNSPASVQVSTNQRITPTAAPGSLYRRLPTDLRPDRNADGAEAVSTASVRMVRRCLS